MFVGEQKTVNLLQKQSTKSFVGKDYMSKLPKYKNLLPAMLCGGFLPFGQFCVALPYPTGNILKTRRFEESKDVLTNYRKYENTVNLFPTGWMNWAKKNWAKKSGQKN